MTRAAFLDALARSLQQAGLARVHPDAVEPTAREVVSALAGLPHCEQLWSGELRLAVQIVAVTSAERVPGVEFARRAKVLADRAEALSERVAGEVQVLQLAVYERPVPAQERDFVVQKARVQPWWPLARGRVATWVVALAEPEVYAGRFNHWPPELAADALRALLKPPSSA